MVQNWISYKKVHERVCLFPPRSGARAFERLIWLKYNIVLKLQITFNLGLLTKIRITSKKGSKRVVRNWILYKKVRQRICLSPNRAELGASKDWYSYYIIWYWNCKLLALLPKIRITSKKASNESCSKLNFVQKSPRASMYISPRADSLQ